MEVPPGLTWIADLPGGSEWLTDLPSLVAAAQRRFHLTVGSPFAGSHVSLVLPATTASGTAVVVKLRFPGDRESVHEADALRAWDGRGAVRLLDEAPELAALLIERAVPGSALTDLAGTDPGAALDVLVDLLPRLSVAPPAHAPFATLTDEATRWRTELPARWSAAGCPGPEAVVPSALDALVELTVDPPDPVLVHQDLHGDNVLRADTAGTGRGPWLAIDPKPLVGEPAFALAPVIRSCELGHSRDQVVHRLDRLSSRLGLDRERARRWALAQTLAWAIGPGAPGGVHAHLLEVAVWLHGAGP